VRQPEACRGDGGHDGALVVGRDDGVERPGGGEAGDLSGGRLWVAQVEGEAAFRGDVFEGLLPVGADDRLDAEAAGRFQEVVGAVGGGREKEEDARPRPLGAGRGGLALQTRSSIEM
jgi:hypothetical protein